MQNRILAVGVLLSVLLAQALTPAQAQEIAAPSPAVVNLEQVLEGKPTATVNAGGGVTLVLATAERPVRARPDHHGGRPAGAEIRGRQIHGLRPAGGGSHHLLGH